MAGTKITSKKNLVNDDVKPYVTVTVINSFHNTASYASQFVHQHLRSGTR
jgi:hypothetical protein